MSEQQPEEPHESLDKAGVKPHSQLPRFTSPRFAASVSLLDVACDKLRRAGASLHVAAPEQERMEALLRRLCAPWGDAPVGQPRYYSNVSLEGMPFELSYAWGGKGYELRMSFETLSEPPEPRAGLEACRRFTRRVEDQPGVSLASYLRVEDLFVSPRTIGMAPMAHGVAWVAGAPAPVYKVYLNPNIDGFEQGLARTAEAMERLGAGPAWQAYLAHLARIGAPAALPVVIALDLGDPARSRIKVYVPHSDVDAAAIDQQAEIAATHVKGKFEQALRVVTGHGSAGWQKMPVTCLTLVPGVEQPASATLYVPLIPDLGDDGTACARVCQFVREEGGDPASYEALLRAVSDRPLGESATQNFVSYRPGPQPRFAVYIAPGVYG